MMDKYMEQLRTLDEAEHIFGEAFLDEISCEDHGGILFVRAADYPGIAMKKEGGFEENYFALIRYLTIMKNRQMNGAEPHDETSYYRDWIDFRTSYNIRLAWFYLNVNDTDDPEEVSDLFVSALGRLNYHTIAAMFATGNEDYHQHVRIVMQYVGSTRAVRNLCMKYLDPKYGTQWEFHLWHLTPCTVIEDYGYIFYLGNELDSLDFCPYTYKAKEYYYKDFYRKLCDNLKRDIPKNQGISEEQKKAVWKEISEEVLESDEYLRETDWDDMLKNPDEYFGQSEFEEEFEDDFEDEDDLDLF